MKDLQMRSEIFNEEVRINEKKANDRYKRQEEKIKTKNW